MKTILSEIKPTKLFMQSAKTTTTSRVAFSRQEDGNARG